MNSICHVEIPSKDYQKARKFYGDVFGWKFDETEGMKYMTFTTPDGPNGGFNQEFETSSKPGIIVYIEVEDMLGTIKKAEEVGGKTKQGKTQISPEFGYFAFITDLEGNQIGLWSKN